MIFYAFLTLGFDAKLHKGAHDYKALGGTFTICGCRGIIIFTLATQMDNDESGWPLLTAMRLSGLQYIINGTSSAVGFLSQKPKRPH